MPNRSVLSAVRKRSIFSLWDHLFWGSVGVAIAVWTLAVNEDVPTDQHVDYVTRGLVFAAACVTVPGALELCFRAIMNWVSNIDHFIHCSKRNPVLRFVGDLYPYFSRKRMYSIGLLWGVTAVALTQMYSLHLQALAAHAKLLGMAALFFADVLAGAALTAMYGLARALWRIGTNERCVLRLSRDNFGVLSTGRLMLKVWGAGLTLWMLYMIPVVQPMAHSGAAVLRLEESPVTVTLAVPALIFILASFVACQVPLHRKMLDAKRARVAHFRALVDEVVPSTPDGASDELVRKVEFFESRLLIAEQLPEWPSTLLVALGTILISVISTILPAALSPFLRTVVGQVVKIVGAAS